MNNLCAVILSAGMGKRLFPETKDKTKALVEIGNKALLYYSLYNLYNEGIRNVLIVGGYKFDNLQKWIMENKKMFLNMNFTLIYNDKYDVLNNAYTLKVALNYIKNDFLILNSDIIYDHKILEKVFSVDSNALIIDNVKKLGKEQMKALVENGYIVSLRKDNPVKDSIGEYIGITYYKEKYINILKEKMRNFDFENDKKYYEDVLMETVKENIKFIPVFTENYKWTEIDDFNDLEFAKNVVFKSIKNFYV